MKIVDEKLEQDAIVQKERQQLALNASIRIALDLENAFKLYSYRIIDHDTFLEMVSEAVNAYDDLITKTK